MKNSTLKTIFTAALALTLPLAVAAKTVTLLNVSYDPTRELYEKYNTAFAKYWKGQTGDDVKVNQSHGGSGKQARSVIDGLDADIVSLALPYDVDVIAQKSGQIPTNWAKLKPVGSTPYSSTIVFLVRKGNPKGIKDWGDLIKPGIKVISPNPKTSGGARYNYLAAWAYAKHLPGGSDASAKDFLRKLFLNVPVLDAGARGATTTFVERRIGDVLITWENEAQLALREQSGANLQVVYPPKSILAKPPVAVVSKVAARHGTTKVANAYLDYLYSAEGQEIIAQNYYRPVSGAATEKYKANFPKIEFWTVETEFGGWAKAQATHFADGGTFDQIYKK